MSNKVLMSGFHLINSPNTMQSNFPDVLLHSHGHKSQTVKLN